MTYERGYWIEDWLDGKVGSLRLEGIIRRFARRFRIEKEGSACDFKEAKK